MKVGLEEIVRVREVGRVRGGDEEKGEEKERIMKAKGRDHGGKEGAAGKDGLLVRALEKAFEGPQTANISLLPIFSNRPQKPSRPGHTRQLSRSNSIHDDEGPCRRPREYFIQPT